MKKLFFLMSFFILSSCGGTSVLQINLSGQAAFSDTNVKDIVIVIENVPTSAGGLDQDKDGRADSFVFPEDCGSAKPAGCGYSRGAGDVTLGDLPLNFRFRATVQLRNTSGSVLYVGSTVFDNRENSQAVNVVLN
jgi:hypothetical protein